MKLCAILCLALGLVGAIGFKAEGSAPRTVASLRFDVTGPGGATQKALGVWPIPVAPGEKLPVVIALHGKAESELGAERGYAAWIERYALRRAYDAMLAGALGESFFGAGMVRPAELAALNHGLRVHPFGGVIVVCVYTPQFSPGPAGAAELDRFATWIARELVPQVHRTFPFASTSPRHIGIDGVSLGGALALEVGLRFPDVFGSVGAIQPAIDGREVELAELAQRARHRPQRIRLLSSDDDPYLAATRNLSRSLRARRIAHDLVVTPGAHDYAFNRGSGAIGLLRFHDLALRRVTQ
ncbi:MAG: alpha/beta hydrolase-fold protein [Polyangiales bacterium]